MTSQPDLFGEQEAAEAYAAMMQQPATCPACGNTAPNGWLLRTNHGITPGSDTIGGFALGQHPIYRSMCLAQYNVANHLASAARRGGDPEWLAQIRARALQLDLDVDAITTQEEPHAGR